MAGQGNSATSDEMPTKDNFFAQLDTDDTQMTTPVKNAETVTTPPIGEVIEQEADRLERLKSVKPPEAEPAGDKSDTDELKQMLKAQAENVNALIDSNKAKPTQEPQKPQPKNLAEYLFGDKAEEFVYDPEEAVSDPNSDSAKYHRAEIALEARKQIDRAKAEDDEESAQKAFIEEKASLMAEYGMSQQDFDKFETEASERNVSLKDLYLMIHRDKISKNITKNLTDQSAGQRTRMAALSPNLASSGGHEVQKPSSSQFFSSVFNINDNDFETTI